MVVLDVAVITDRGLKDFQSLSPLERDVFVLNDLDLCFEMEGGFEDYILSKGHEPQLNWLEDTLGRSGDEFSLALIRRLRSAQPKLDERELEPMSALCQRYYERRDTRWQLLEQYLEGRGARLKG